MARISQSERVPKPMQDTFNAIIALTDAFCRAHLDEEYAQLARQATAALCRKRSSPLAQGKLNTWACGIVYALGFVNFLFDRSQHPSMSAAELCAGFGVSKSTGAAKAKVVREALAMGQMDPRWYRPSKMEVNPEEANRLASACKDAREKLLVWTLLDTGLRVAELANLKKDNIDWQGHRLMIYGKGGPYGSKSKRRIIPLSNRIQPLIEGHFALNDTLGMTPRTIQNIVKDVANRARISRPVSPHVLRHTFAVAAVQKGISLPALQRLLGHDRLTTTEICLNLSPEDVVREFRDKW
ncbi:MAG: DUF6398 domain-containing protein [Candidatus Entotheonellia bacterium]